MPMQLCSNVRVVAQKFSNNVGQNSHGLGDGTFYMTDLMF